MKSARLLVTTVLCTTLAATGAFATDILPPAPPPPPPVVVPPPPAFDWSGFYLGIGGSRAYFSFPSQEWHLSAYAGVNFALGTSALAGIEGYFTWWWPASNWRAGAEARVGFLVTPTILLYGAVGFAHYQGGNNYLTLGPGVEFALGRALSLDLAYDFERGLNVGATGHRFTASINWHIGN